MAQMAGGIGAMTIAGWRLYYSDGSKVDSNTSTWRDAPSNDIQALIVFYNEHYTIHEGDELKVYPYRKVYCSQDYYWETGAGTALEALGKPDIKLGKLISDARWWAIYEQVHQDMRLD